MLNWSERGDAQVPEHNHVKPPTSLFHERADHEDNLYLSRASVLLSFNGFIAVAVGLPMTPALLRCVLSLMVLAVDSLWVRWAPNSLLFIRGLRSAGRDRPDEQLRLGLFAGHKLWLSSPLVIMTRWIPWLLTVGWLLISGFFIEPYLIHLIKWLPSL